MAHREKGAADMLKCKTILMELEAFRADRSTCKLSNEIDSHLKTCSDCQKELDTLKKLDILINNYQVTPVSDGFRARLQEKIAAEEQHAAEHTYRFSINWHKAGILASAAIILIAVSVWIINPFGIDDNKTISTSQETEIINNLDLFEDIETVELIDFVDDYELVEAFPEVIDVDFNGQH